MTELANKIINSIKKEASSGDLVCLTVGNDQNPADQETMELMAGELEKYIKTADNVRGLICPHLVKIKKETFDEDICFNFNITECCNRKDVKNINETIKKILQEISYVISSDKYIDFDGPFIHDRCYYGPKEKKMSSALDELQGQVIKDVEEGSLLVVTVGSEQTPATKNDMARVAKTIQGVLKDVNGVRVLIIPHLIKVEKLPLKALRTIQSSVVQSTWDEDGTNVIIDCLGDITLLGE